MPHDRRTPEGPSSFSRATKLARRRGKYRGRLLDCLRAYVALAGNESTGMSVTVWRLAPRGGFEVFPSPPEKDKPWVVKPFTRDQMKAAGAAGCPRGEKR